MGRGLSAEVKSLQGRLDKEKSNKFILEKEAKELKAKIRISNNEIERLKSQLKRITESELIITEHALLRYCERVELIPIEDIPNKVLTDELRRINKTIGGGKIPIWNGKNHAVIKNNTIITFE